MIYVISAIGTDQILKTGKIRPTIKRTRGGGEYVSVNPNVAYKKILQVSETFNIPVRDLELQYFERSA